MNRIPESFVVLVFCASAAWAADQSKADVRVVNTPADPVPVAITGATADPLPFVKGLPGELFAGHALAVMHPGPVSEDTEFVVQVPEGKTLVLEAASGEMRAVGCAPVVRIVVRVANPCETCPPELPPQQWLRFTPVGQNFSETKFVANDPLHLYAPSGSSVEVVAGAPVHACDQSDVVARVTVLGHYVPAE